MIDIQGISCHLRSYDNISLSKNECTINPTNIALTSKNETNEIACNLGIFTTTTMYYLPLDTTTSAHGSYLTYVTYNFKFKVIYLWVSLLKAIFHPANVYARVFQTKTIKNKFANEEHLMYCEFIHPNYLYISDCANIEINGYLFTPLLIQVYVNAYIPRE